MTQRCVDCLTSHGRDLPTHLNPNLFEQRLQNVVPRARDWLARLVDRAWTDWKAFTIDHTWWMLGLIGVVILLVIAWILVPGYLRGRRQSRAWKRKKHARREERREELREAGR